MSALLGILLDSLSYAAWIFLASVGMTLAFGVMKILNVAHGSFYTLGAYAAATLIGVWFRSGWPPMASFAVLLIAAVLVAGIAGVVIERVLMRWLYGRDEVVIALSTYAAFLMMEDIVPLIWGLEAVPAYQPYSLLGTVKLAGLNPNLYDVGLICIAAVVALLTWLVLRKTPQGLLVQTVMHDAEGAAAFGVNVRGVYLACFLASAFLGALAGAATAPMISVAPGIGVEVVVIAFAVVVIGGLGSVPGALVGALIVGVCRAVAIYFAPYLELFAIYGVMAAVLIVRPNGLFSARQLRKI